MLAEDINNLEAISQKRDVLVQISNGKLKVINDVRDLPIEEGGTLGDLISKMNEKNQALADKLSTLESNYNKVIDLMKVMQK